MYVFYKMFRQFQIFSGITRNLLVCRNISSTSYVAGIPRLNKLPPRPKWLIVEEEIEESFLKGGRGPGGQKINKSNSKVQLTHKPTGIVVTCQYSRSQELNRKRAREILALKLEDLKNPLTSRNSVIQERKSKLKQSKSKKSNRKYKALADAKEDEETPEEEEIDPDEEFDKFMEDLNKNEQK